MRIAVAADQQTQVALHTGRCEGFAVYDVADQAIRFVEHRVNGFTAHAHGECDGSHSHDESGGHHSHGALVDALADCQVLVTRGLGPRLVTDLAARGVQAYVCNVETVEEAAKLFALGQLPRASGQCSCCHR